MPLAFPAHWQVFRLNKIKLKKTMLQAYNGSEKLKKLAPVVRVLKYMGFKTTKPRHENANGSDLFAIKDDYVLSVEIKHVSNRKDKNSLRITPVSRKNDDLIAIVLPSGYVLVEPMKDHLKCCNASGYRYLNY